MHDHSLIWFVEDIAESGRDVGKQSNGITEEIGRSEDSVDLTNKLFLVVEYDPLLQRGHIQSNVLQSKRSEVDGGGIDVSERHCKGIEDVVEHPSRVEPTCQLLTEAILKGLTARPH